MKNQTELVLKVVGNVLVVVAVGVVLLIAGFRDIAILKSMVTPISIIGFFALIGVNVIQAK